jgi:hypothetical protein
LFDQNGQHINAALKYKDVDSRGVESSDNSKMLNFFAGSIAEISYEGYGNMAVPAPISLNVPHHAVLGVGVSTLSDFTLRPYMEGIDKSYVELATGEAVVLEPNFGDGDGTVPSWSLHTNDPRTYNYYVPDFGEGDSAAHADIPANPRVQEFVKELIFHTAHSKDPAPPTDGIYRSYSEVQPAIRSVKEPCGITDEITGLCTLDFVIHSDAHMSVGMLSDDKYELGYNSFGGISENLPGGTFLSIDGVEYASIQGAHGNYRVLPLG